MGVPDLPYIQERGRGKDVLSPGFGIGKVLTTKERRKVRGRVLPSSQDNLTRKESISI